MANLNVSYEEMEGAARRLVTGREELDTKLQELRTYITNLVNSGFVTDAASKKFDETYETFTTNATGTVSALNDLSSYLTNAAETLRSTDQQLSNI
ncbi:WXG100 family type VII secretion target [Georgenia wangjunii]|uniref:WXG100 family type VII secretion target n=1 Tax=Georgenia wangjunii TaxID=3117730 RepID=UPI002F25FFB4